MKPKIKKQLEHLDFEIKFYEGILNKKPDFIQALVALGDNYSKRGMFEKGLFIDKRLLNLKPDDPVVWYNLACDYSLLNKIDEAFEALEKSIKFGYDDFQFISKDPDLENLRQDERFKKVILNFKKK